MFIKCAGSLYNASVFSCIKVRYNDLMFYIPTSNKPLCVVHYPSEELAAYAYGRIIHGFLGKWGCVDATEETIVRLYEEREKEA